MSKSPKPGPRDRAANVQSGLRLGPYQLVSLWAMLERHAFSFYIVGRNLRTFSKYVAEHRDADIEATVKWINEFLPDIRSRCSQLALTSAIDGLDRLDKIIAERENSVKSVGLAKAMESLYYAIFELEHRVEDDLKRKTVIYVPGDRADLYQNPTKGWESTITTFGVTTSDVEEAGRCYALGRPTACVYHLMKVTEAGLQALASKLDPAIDTSKSWGEIEPKVSEAVKKLPRGTGDEIHRKSEYNKVATHLFHVRWAWRNDTMHPKSSYSEDEAFDILGKVRVFMNQLAVTVAL